MDGTGAYVGKLPGRENLLACRRVLNPGAAELDGSLKSLAHIVRTLRMTIPSLTHSYGTLTSEENALIDEAMSDMPGCTLQLVARAMVRTGDDFMTGALGLVREHLTNGFSLKLFDTCYLV